jgi:hypothetical protein
MDEPACRPDRRWDEIREGLRLSIRRGLEGEIGYIGIQFLFSGNCEHPDLDTSRGSFPFSQNAEIEITRRKQDTAYCGYCGYQYSAEVTRQSGKGSAMKAMPMVIPG